MPWDTPCKRVEGASLFSPCTVGISKGGITKPVSNKRHVIDETMRSYNIHVVFGSAGGNTDGHEFVQVRGREVEVCAYDYSLGIQYWLSLRSSSLLLQPILLSFVLGSEVVDKMAHGKQLHYIILGFVPSQLVT